MPKKLNVAVIFGGRSGEHEVSLSSAGSVMKALDKKKYNIIPVGITKDGQWIAGDDALDLLKSGDAPRALKAALIPDTSHKSLVITDDKKSQTTAGQTARITKSVDVVFPVLHGTYGEDGAIQGLLELSGLPYVGCGILSSAVAMDKITQKMVCEARGIPVADWIWLDKKEWLQFKKNKTLFGKWLKEAEKKLGYPMFVKPSNLGSSVGITKVHKRQEMPKALSDAFCFDRRVMMEKGIEEAWEIEVSVLGNDCPRASVPGRVLPSNEFYDYNAKYVDGKSKLIIPALLPKDTAKKVREIAVDTFKLLDGAGMARVDFLIQPKAGWKIYLCELNTIPGFTSISMYPKLWEATGISYGKLLDMLIKLAQERWQEKNILETDFEGDKKWYR